MTHITIERAKLEQVLEALGDPVLLNGVNNAKFFISQALAQPAQQSLAHLHHCNMGEYLASCKYGDENCPALEHAAVKTKMDTLAQRTWGKPWVSLTFAEICECENDYLHLFARAVEAKLKAKNGFPQEEKNT